MLKEALEIQTVWRVRLSKIKDGLIKPCWDFVKIKLSETCALLQIQKLELMFKQSQSRMIGLVEI